MYKAFSDKIFYLGIVLLPFMGTISFTKKVFSPFGDGLFLCVSIGAILWLLSVVLFRQHVLAMPSHRILRSAAIFLFVILLSGFVNIHTMLVSIWQGALGINRYVLSIVLLLYYFIIYLYIYNLAIRDNCFQYRFLKAISLSFIISSFCSIIEIFSLLDIPGTLDFLTFIDSIYRGDIMRQFYRIQSFASEPSVYSNYLSIIYPFFLSNFCFQKSKKIAFMAINLLWVLLLFTFSRTGYFIVFLETVMYLYIIWKKNNYGLRFIYSIRPYLLLECGILVLISILGGIGSDIYNMEYILRIITSFSDNNIYANMSNVTRIASSVAGFYIFLDHPVLGIGYDQFAFYAAEYYPSWAYVSSEIVQYATNYTDKNLWPPLYIYYIRLLAEVGIIGFLSFIYLLYGFLRIGIKSVENTNEQNGFTLALFVAFIGQLLNLVNISDLNSTFILLIAMLSANGKQVLSKIF